MFFSCSAWLIRERHSASEWGSADGGGEREGLSLITVHPEPLLKVCSCDLYPRWGLIQGWIITGSKSSAFNLCAWRSWCQSAAINTPTWCYNWLQAFSDNGCSNRDASLSTDTEQWRNSHCFYSKRLVEYWIWRGSTSSIWSLVVPTLSWKHWSE